MLLVAAVPQLPLVHHGHTGAETVAEVVLARLSEELEVLLVAEEGVLEVVTLGLPVLAWAPEAKSESLVGR